MRRAVDAFDERVAELLDSGMQEFVVPVRASELPSLARLDAMTELFVGRLQDAGVSVLGVDMQPWTNVAFISCRADDSLLDRSTPTAAPLAPGYEAFLASRAAESERDMQREEDPGRFLPINHDLPDEGDFHVIWQFYYNGSSGDEIRRRAAHYLTSNPWSMQFGVIDPAGRGVTVDGAHASSWTFTDRACEANEWLAIWEFYIDAPNAVAAKQTICEIIEQTPDEIAAEIKVYQDWPERTA